MLKTIKLKTPFKANGEEIKELSYDLDALTVKDKLEAGKKFKVSGGVVNIQELDTDYHLYIGMEAIVKANKGITEQDLMRLGMQDAVVLSNAVRDYFFLGSEDISQTNTSEKQ